MNTGSFKCTLSSCLVNLCVQQLRHALSYTMHDAGSSKKALDILNDEVLTLRTKSTQFDMALLKKDDAIKVLEQQNRHLMIELDVLKQCKVSCLCSYITLLY